MNNKPLVVDLDGTLLKSDILLESGLAFLRAQPLRFYRPLLWLLRDGKAQLKARLAEIIFVDITTLPFNAQLLEWLREEKARGRSLVLATATHQSYAEEIGNHLGLFDRVLATNQSVNLSAERKRDALVDAFGEKGFDYVGNSHDDMTVWAAANAAIVVDPEPGVARRAGAMANFIKIIETRNGAGKAWLKQLRLHQWLKNLLIFVPLLASHQFRSLPLLTNALLAFLFFSLCASSVYLLNDLLDLNEDRRHPTKRLRPFAAGTLSVKRGIIAFPLLFFAALTGSFLLLPLKFTAALLLYFLVTLAYSLLLKRIVIVDVVALALLYTIRIIAGTMACYLDLSFWLLAFSMFMFLSLALVKRYAELHMARAKGDDMKISGRGYYPSDLEMISSLGAASGYLSVMVLALYIQDQSISHLYSHPRFIWLACPLLLFWVSRTWMLTHRGQMHDDPVVFAVKDRVSLLTGALMVLVFWIAV
ncbi:MAG TPA: UbiA family prenyltransferase [Spongiibacteraceae bacterium]